MPNLDKTGPKGKGPKTGRGLGTSSPSSTPSPVRRGQGVGSRSGNAGRRRK
jgi:hypothetical protein